MKYTMSANVRRKSKFTILKNDLKRNRTLYIMIIPVILFYLYFCYRPMYGALIAFKEYNPVKGIIGSEWIGFENFREFFTSVYFFRVLKNTLVISLSSLIFCFPAPIIFALLINELQSKIFKSAVQTVTYMPHFISLVVICSMVNEFTALGGIINNLISFFGGEEIQFMNEPKWFVPIYIISDLWQSLGWNSIIYLAALSGVDEALYDAAKIDGAGRIRQTISVTLPALIPTIVTLLILRIGTLLSVGYEKIILLYTPMTYETADVISSYVYRAGLINTRYGYAGAVGLFNSVINFILVLSANTISRKVNGTSLW